MDHSTFRHIAGRFATGVTIVTTQAQDGAPQGLTVNSFSTLSMNPMLVLVCIDKQAALFEPFNQADTYAVNILKREQEALSKKFAASDTDRFAGIPYARGKMGAPLLHHCLGYFDCRLVNKLDGGDHVIFVGEVLDGGVEEGEPLIFYSGQYRGLS